jgi:hypothetical protein
VTTDIRAHALEQGRESFRKQAWGAAFSQLSAADGEAPLEAEDLVLLAQTALLIGKDADGSDFLARAHQGFVDSNNAQLAARCAFWLGFTLLIRANRQEQEAGFLVRVGCSTGSQIAWRRGICCCRQLIAQFIQATLLQL